MKLAVFAALLFPVLAAAEAPQWITNVHIVSPEKLDRIDIGSVLVADGRIAAVHRGAATPPAGAQVVDGQGGYLTPGLIDSHVHLHVVPGMALGREKPELAAAYYQQLPRSYLYYGFTTLVDLALPSAHSLDGFLKTPLHPDVLHCGEPAVLANGYPMSWAAKEDRFRIFSNYLGDPRQVMPADYKAEEHTPEAVVERAYRAGAACVKTHFERGFGADRNLPVMTPQMYADVRAAAKKRGLVMVTHANGLEGQQFAIEGQADVLAHGLWNWGSARGKPGVPPEVASVLDKVVERRIGYQTTMQVMYGLRAYFDGFIDQPEVRKVVPGALADWYKTPEGRWFKEEAADGDSDEVARTGIDSVIERLSRVVSYLAKRDANFLMGSDTPSSPTYGNLPGLNGYLEMQHLHQAGLSLEQVFKAATINNARAFGINAGTIEAGKAANLLLMKTSPLTDAASYDRISTIWIKGQAVQREALSAH